MPGKAVELLHSAAEMINYVLFYSEEIVAQSRTDFVFLAVVLYRWERAAGGYQSFAF